MRLGIVAHLFQYYPDHDDRWIWSIAGMIVGKEELKCSEGNLLNPTLSATNPTWATLELNLGLHGEKLWWLTAWSVVQPHFINPTKIMSVENRNQKWGLA